MEAFPDKGSLIDIRFSGLKVERVAKDEKEWRTISGTNGKKGSPNKKGTKSFLGQRNKITLPSS